MIRVVLARRLMLLGSFSLTALVIAACGTGGVAPAEDGVGGGAGAAGLGGAAGKGGGAGLAGAAGSVPIAGAAGAAGVSAAGAAGVTGAGMSGAAGATAGAAGTASGAAGSAGTAGASGGTAGASGSAGSSAGQAGAGQGGSAGSGTGGSAGTSAGSAGSAGGGVDPSSCTQDSECNSGHCIEGNNGGKVCGVTCKDGCDDTSFRCALITPGGTADAYKLCVPKYWLSCRPCELDSQCRFPDDSTDASRCVPSTNGTGSFCASDCAFTTCQAGYTCQEKGLPNGQSAKVCVPNGGDLCTCKPFWKDRGYKTTCSNTNGIGSCKGSRSCDTGTLSNCDAPTPTVEICDGLDSDCDGSTDEGSDCSDNLGCTTDTCNPIVGGGAACGHVPQAGSCAIDFQCFASGNTNPKNPCQTCNPALSPNGWTNSNGNTCDDGDGCTTGDKCVVGKCVGSASAGDSREPNNSFAAASPALSWNSCATALSKTVTGTIYPVGDEDWFSMSFVDSPGCATKNEMIFELTPPAGFAIGFDVYFACNAPAGETSPIANCNGANSNGGGGIPGAKGCGVQPASSTSTLRITLGCGNNSDDSGQVWVRAYSLSDKPLCSSYTLNYGQVQ